MTKLRLYILARTILSIAGFILLIQTGCVKENGAPTCSIKIPENGEEIPHGTQVLISVNADDDDGVITGVSFFIDNSTHGISNSRPYQYEWNTLAAETGNHTVRAVATDDDGNSMSSEITVLLTQGVPEADFTAYQTSISTDSSAQFFDWSLNNPTSWLWDFGDGYSSETQNPSHKYSTVGTYTVSLTVTNNYGSDSETKSNYITVAGPLIDYDGNNYQTVQIGKQVWMKENLKTTHYSDGTPLIDGTEVGNISGDHATKYYFSYNDNENFTDVYGRLYSWAAVMNGTPTSDMNPSGVQGVCPSGWHMPSDDEWKELEMFLGMIALEANRFEWRGTNEGAKLKEKSPGHWNGRNDVLAGNDQSGFKALPGGSRWYNESFRNLGERANFWTATESLSDNAWCRRLYYYHADVYRYDDYKSRGYSVRCVQD